MAAARLVSYYVQSPGNWIAASPEEIAVPDWHRRVLEERQAASGAAPDEGTPWEEVRENFQRRLRDRSPQ